MAALRVNILANYAGQIWVAAMGLIFLPMYIRLLGMEAFGLVGLMLSFQAILQLFDFGIGAATNRELARRAHDPALADGARDLVRSTETLIWLFSAIAISLIWGTSNLMAEHWLHLRNLTIAEAGRAVAIMGIGVGLLWPSTFYAQCLSGLEKQPALNVINIVFYTLRFAGVIPVLLYISASVEAFLWWHVLVGAVQSLVSAGAVWRYLPRGIRRGKWSFEQLYGSRHFAGGLFVISLLAVGVTQIDRLTLASLRPLEELGYYTLALSVAAGMGRIVQPMFNAVYPRFSRLVASGDITRLRQLYHLSSQLLAVVVAAAAAVLIVFSEEVLLLWTADPELASKVALPMAILVGGTALNGLMNVPYALQLAHGWTRLAIQMNAVALVLGIPLCLWAVARYGMDGAALPWLTMNIAFFAVGIPLIHRRLLHGELYQWYRQDNAPPLLASFASALGLAAWLAKPTDSLQAALQIGSIGLTVLTASALSSGALRHYLRSLLKSHLRPS